MSGSVDKEVPTTEKGCLSTPSLKRRKIEPKPSYCNVNRRSAKVKTSKSTHKVGVPKKEPNDSNSEEICIEMQSDNPSSVSVVSQLKDQSTMLKIPPAPHLVVNSDGTKATYTMSGSVDKEVPTTEKECLSTPSLKRRKIEPKPSYCNVNRRSAKVKTSKSTHKVGVPKKEPNDSNSEEICIEMQSDNPSSVSVVSQLKDQSTMLKIPPAPHLVVNSDGTKATYTMSGSVDKEVPTTEKECLSTPSLKRRKIEPKPSYCNVNRRSAKVKTSKSTHKVGVPKKEPNDSNSEEICIEMQSDNPSSVSVVSQLKDQSTVLKIPPAPHLVVNSDGTKATYTMSGSVDKEVPTTEKECLSTPSLKRRKIEPKPKPSYCNVNRRSAKVKTSKSTHKVGVPKEEPNDSNSEEICIKMQSDNPSSVSVVSQLNDQSTMLKIPPAPHLVVTSDGTKATFMWDVKIDTQTAAPQKFQLFSKKENPEPIMWKKILEIEAEDNFPMSVEKDSFIEGCTYHFALRIVDVFNRRGPYAMKHITF